MLAKECSKIEVVNDINRDLVSLYRCEQFHLEALCAEIQWTSLASQRYSGPPAS